MDEIRAVARTIEVTIWPEEMAEDGGSDAQSFCVQLERVGADEWILQRGRGHGRGICLTETGWDFGKPLRFSLVDALALAKEWAPKIQCMGLTAAEALDWHRKGCPR